MSRIAIATIGTLGDLHPCLAIGRALVARGHAVTVCTHGVHAPQVAAAGLAFAAVRPDMTDFPDLEGTMRRAMDLRDGSRFVAVEMVARHVRASAADLRAACAGHDLLVAHVLAIAAAPVAEALAIPRVPLVLQPFALLSAHDPPAIAGHSRMTALSRALPAGLRALGRAAGLAATRGWFAGLDALRRDWGLPPAPGHPIFGAWSPALNLAAFSPRFAARQPDWPPGTIATGFPEWTPDEGWDESLRAFLEAGEPPVVFTLGSSAVHVAGDFFAGAAGAARALGVRAVLLTGPGAPTPTGADGTRVRAFAFAPHVRLFPRAAAIVHQGGIGTTARALASGRPSLVVPYSHDQPDNAARCERLGVARVLPRGRWRADRAAAALRALLADAPLHARAAALGEALRAEDGAATAADAIEARLARGRVAGSPGAA